MKKVLGIILSVFFLLLLGGCASTTTAASTTSSSETTLSLGVVSIEVYDADSALVGAETVVFRTGDTLLKLLLDTFGAVCQGEDGGEDETCSYSGSFGTYLLGVGSVLADEDSHQYIALYINGEYALTGIDATPLVDGNVYAFKIATW